MSQVTLVVPSRVALSSAVNIIAEMKKRAERVFIATPRELKYSIRETTGMDFDFVNLDTIISKNRLRLIIHRLLLIFFTPSTFSLSWTRYRNLFFLKGNRILISFFRLIDRFILCDSSRINGRIDFLMRLLFTNPFPTRKLLVFTVPGCEYLFCARSQSVVAIMESWDQASKYPLGYQPAILFVWNKQLMHDWILHQGSFNTRIGYPIKLHYACETVRADSDRKVAKVLYPATFCTSSKGPYFVEELLLISIIASFMEKNGIKLLLKPKPNGTIGEFDDIASRYSCVEIGAYATSARAADYFLDKTYNQIRIDEMDQCDFVLNYGTTFSIDAALHGLPIVQLLVDDYLNFPNISMIQRNSFHLLEHLMGDASEVLRISEADISSLDFLDKRVVTMARKNARRIRERFKPGIPFSEAIANIIKATIDA
jgi:hypothetical protein